MENETCMEYLFHSIERGLVNNINQDILLNASNEFRNVWNLVKKLRDLARVDVKRITCFLDAVQEGLRNDTWNAATRSCMQADNEYRHIRRYIRPSFLEDFKVSLYVVKADNCGKSATKREKKHVPTTANGTRKQSFRNNQINKQDLMSTLGGRSNGTNIDVKKPRAVDIKVKSNENKSCNKESTKSKSIIEKKKDETIGKHTAKSNNSQTEISSKPSKQDGLDSNCHTSDTIKMDRSKSLESDENEENDKSEDYENVISSSTDGTISAREEGDGSERKPECKVTESENESESNQIDNSKDVELNGDTIQEKDSLDTRGYPGDSLNPAGQMTMKIKEDKGVKETEEGYKQGNNSYANEANNKDNYMLADDISVKEKGANKSPQEPISTVEENCTQRRPHGDSVVDDEKSVHLNSIKMVSEQMTRIGFKCKPDEILIELSHVYETDWNRAYNALTGCQPSNGIKNTIDFLGEILKVSAKDVRKALELRDEKQSAKEYLQKLKQVFLTQHLKILQKEHDIEYHNEDADEHAVNLYSAKCVELSWIMLTQSPPMVFDYDSRPMLLEDLLEIFRPYKNEGHCIHYIVWPAIRRSKYDIVVAQGIAEFR